MGGKPWRFIAEKVLPLPPAQVWELLSNTEHLNRTIGLPSVVYEAPVVSDGDFYRHASIKLLGLISVRWKEYPFRWVRHERYSVLRVFEGGLLERVLGWWVAKQSGTSGATVKPLSCSAAQAARVPIRAPVPARPYRPPSWGCACNNWPRCRSSRT